MRDNKDHRVLALKDFQDKDYEDVLKRPVFCSKQEHTKEELKFFCKNCETAVCQTCVLLEHGGHTLNLIKEEAERQRGEMKSLIAKQRRNLQEKLNVVRRLDEEYAKWIQQGEDVKQDIQRIVDNLHAIIEAKKQNIFSAVENQTMKSLESVTNRKTKTEEQITVIKSSLVKADKLLTQSSNAEVVQQKKSLEMILKGVDQTRQTDNDPEGLPVRLAFVENQKLLNSVNIEKLGSLEILHQTKASHSVAEGKGLEEGTVGDEMQFVLTTKNAQGRHCYNEHDRVTVEIRDERGRKCTTEVRINDNKNGSYKIVYSVRDQGTYKVALKLNGEDVFASPFTVQIKPLSQFTPVLCFGKKGSSVGVFTRPWAVAVNERDEIAVTDYDSHRVQMFDSDGNYLRSFGKHGNKAGEFDSPNGIAFHKNGNIFVADNGNHRIQIFRGEGEYVGMFDGKGSIDSQLSDPWGLSVDSDGNIIVADANDKLIKIFSPDGKFLMKIGGQGSVTCPMHCIQWDRYLIVSEHVEHCIKVFDRGGSFQYKFGKRGKNDGELSSPRFLSVSKSGHLMVCDEGNHRIQVFELSGKFVGKFGTKGSNLGEFNSPWSVGVLSDGRIAVSDQSNRRIQIFK